METTATETVSPNFIAGLWDRDEGTIQYVRVSNFYFATFIIGIEATDEMVSKLNESARNVEPVNQQFWDMSRKNQSAFFRTKVSEILQKTLGLNEKYTDPDNGEMPLVDLIELR